MELDHEIFWEIQDPACRSSTVFVEGVSPAIVSFIQQQFVGLWHGVASNVGHIFKQQPHELLATLRQ